MEGFVLSFGLLLVGLTMLHVATYYMSPKYIGTRLYMLPLTVGVVGAYMVIGSMLWSLSLADGQGSYVKIAVFSLLVAVTVAYMLTFGKVMEKKGRRLGS